MSEKEEKLFRNKKRPTEESMESAFPKCPISKLKLHFSFEDLPSVSHTTKRKKLDEQCKRSQSCSNVTIKKYSTNSQYNHIQSKIKKYMQENKKQACEEVTKTEALIVNENVPNSDDKVQLLCLVQLNKRLNEELEEKNRILLKMQDNYEKLMLKYAEAQNRIDQLRLGVPLTEPSIAKSDNDCISDVGENKNVTANVVEEFKVEKDKRPDSLSIAKNFLIVEKNIQHGVTPTDSDMSSVKTSISGHSKILNNLDGQGNNEDDDDNGGLTEEVLKLSNDMNYQQQSSAPFDKVKEWQNSLPPLEFIEAPENNSYDIPLFNMNSDISPSTNYKDIQRNVTKGDVTSQKHMSQEIMKKYLRTLSLPSSLSRRNLLSMVYKQRSHHTIDICLPTTNFNKHNFSCQTNDKNKEQASTSSLNVSLFQCENSKPGKFRNNIFIPSLDLENLTLSDDDTTQEKTVSRSNINSSLVLSNTQDSIFTESVNSCNATISQYSDVKPIFHKSTSITPERSKDMFFQVNKHNENTNDKLVPSNSCHLLFNENLNNQVCNICGEFVYNEILPPNRSSSCQALPNDYLAKSIRSSRQPLNRSVSFTSDTSSFVCFHDSTSTPYTPFKCNNTDFDQFEVYTNNLKARSQVIMKALTAHVNNS